jgi:hypothetical protein
MEKEEEGQGSMLGKRSRRVKKQVNDHLDLNFLDVL